MAMGYKSESGCPVEKRFVLGIIGFAGSLALASIPSKGSALILAPLFAIGALMALMGLYRHNLGFIETSLLLFAIAAGGRALALVGVDQHGAGSKWAASLTWGWIMIMALLLLDAVSERGVKW